VDIFERVELCNDLQSFGCVTLYPINKISEATYAAAYPLILTFYCAF